MPLFQACHLVLNWNTLNCNEILKKWVWFHTNQFLFTWHTSNHGYGYFYGRSVLENIIAVMYFKLPT